MDQKVDFIDALADAFPWETLAVASFAFVFTECLRMSAIATDALPWETLAAIVEGRCSAIEIVRFESKEEGESI